MEEDILIIKFSSMDNILQVELDPSIYNIVFIPFDKYIVLFTSIINLGKF